jgi:Cu(I)/Ag(I) efflux system protein CusF
MKLTLIAFTSTIIALSISAQAEDMPGMKVDGMDGMEGMQMKQETTQAPVATADGTIKAIDTTKRTVTIAHVAAAIKLEFAQ